MKFFHLSDLHIGKILHGYSLKEDQEHILEEVVAYAKEIRPDAVVIAGDIYDKSVPSAEAVSVFDEFLTKLCAIEPKIPVLLIAGNHDSAQRLDYLSRILGSQQIYIAGRVPAQREERLKKVTLTDSYGEVDFYLLPFLKPGYIRGLFEEEAPETYSEAVLKMIEREEIDWSRRNVLVSHQFYTGTEKEILTCDSETFSVGGIDNVDCRVIEKFDYAALGHLHRAQTTGKAQICYCGTLLKYSVSEAEQEKALHVVELGAKGEAVRLEQFCVHPLRDVRIYRGELEAIIESVNGQEEKCGEDYVSITLTDEGELYKPKEQLEKVFSHILELRLDNSRTRKKLEFDNEEVTLRSPLTVFADFFREMQGRELSLEEQRIVEEAVEAATE